MSEAVGDEEGRRRHDEASREQSQQQHAHAHARSLAVLGHGPWATTGWRTTGPGQLDFFLHRVLARAGGGGGPLQTRFPLLSLACPAAAARAEWVGLVLLIGCPVHRASIAHAAPCHACRRAPVDAGGAELSGGAGEGWSRVIVSRGRMLAR